MTMISGPRKELVRAIGELYGIETGISTSDAKAAVVNVRSVLTRIQGESLRSADRRRAVRHKARALRITFNAAIDACNEIDLFLEHPAWRNRRFVSASLIMHDNLSTIEAYVWPRVM
jgi:hypothetical protein